MCRVGPDPLGTVNLMASRTQDSTNRKQRVECRQVLCQAKNSYDKYISQLDRTRKHQQDNNLSHQCCHQVHTFVRYRLQLLSDSRRIENFPIGKLCAFQVTAVLDGFCAS